MLNCTTLIHKTTLKFCLQQSKVVIKSFILKISSNFVAYYYNTDDMKKDILSVLGFLSCFTAFAQIYVSPNSYVFVNDQFMYVAKDVNLQNNANFYLRNNAQLLQGGTVAGTNSGSGDLSVFQEGTVNNFQYNYWCAPIGAAVAAAGNNPFGVSRLFKPTGVISSAATTTTSGFDGVANPLTISTRWIYKFITSSAYAQWVFVGPNTTINPGEGFTMKGTSDTDNFIAQTAEGVKNNAGSKQRYDFRGKPNEGNISVAVSTNNFTLVGNPYPSAIDLDAYLLDLANAAVIDGTAYFWEQSVINTHILNQYQGGYGVYTGGGGYLPADVLTYNGDGSVNTDTGADGALYKRKFSPIGQGFMVMGKANGVVTMKNSFRTFVKEGVANDSEFARSANNLTSNNTPESEFYPEIPNVAGIDYTTVRRGYAPQIRINAVVNEAGIIHTALGFGDQYTDGVDYSADARATSDDAPFGFYYVLNDSPNEFAMSLTSFDSEKRLPIGLRSNAQATFKIKVSEVLYGFDANQEVYVFDKQTGIYHDIKDNSFEMTLPAGDNRTRFEITFENGTLSSDDIAAINNSFTVIQNNNAGMLTLINTNNKEIAAVVVYDITGKQVINKTNLGTAASYEFATGALSDGVYVVKATTTDNIVVSKKVSVYKK